MTRRNDNTEPTEPEATDSHAQVQATMRHFTGTETGQHAAGDDFFGRLLDWQEKTQDRD